MTKDNGGPAYPAPVEVKTDWTLKDVTSGMSLRDWFAGQTLAAFGGKYWLAPSEAPEIAKRAFAVADAMLVERSK